MSAKRSFCIASFVLAQCCGSVYADQTDSVDDRTMLWADNLIDNCSTLSGEYISTGESSVSRKSNYDLPRLESAVFGIDDLEHEATFVRIEQEVDSALSVFVEDENGNLLSTRNFPPPDFCDGAWAVYELNVKGSGGESSVLETNTVSKMARSNDGALILLTRVTTVSRSWVVLRKSVSYEVWYLFAGANSRVDHLNEDSLR